MFALDVQLCKGRAHAPMRGTPFFEPWSWLMHAVHIVLSCHSPGLTVRVFFSWRPDRADISTGLAVQAIPYRIPITICHHAMLLYWGSAMLYHRDKMVPSEIFQSEVVSIA
jgi:hypothetical protein